MNIDDYYEQQGSGSPIVFIHGSYATTSTWKKMIEQLALHHHCISIKLPGHCGTPDPDDFSKPSMNVELNILERVITKLTDEPIHLVGHSYGGVVALALALKGDIALSQMTLYEPVAVWALDPEKDHNACAVVQQFLTKYFRDVAEKKPYACGQVIEFWGGAGAFESLPSFIKDGMEKLVDNNIRHWNICKGIESSASDLKRLNVPTRLVCGTKSNLVAGAISDRLNSLLPRSKKIIIEGASHFLVTSHSNSCLAALTDQSIIESS